MKKMNLQETARLMLEKYNLCDYCFGRQFSNLATGTTNLYRGQVLKTFLTMAHSSISSDQDKLILENLSKSDFTLAKKVLKKKDMVINPTEECFICENSLERTDDLVELIKSEINEYEVEKFLVGTSIPKEMYERESIIKKEFNTQNSEFLKQEFNRNIGKKLSDALPIDTDFNNPEVVIEVDPFNMSCALKIRSLYIYGRYKKFLRTIPQTRWPCRKCKGKGCKECNETGKRYVLSVEELIEVEAVKESKGEKGVLHGAGREDIDALMLGNGRPFVLEIINPKIRTLNLKEIEKSTNLYCKDKVEVNSYRWSSKKEVIHLKGSADETSKTYRALISFSGKIAEKKIKEIEAKFTDVIIKQRTPIRVTHRRADKIREKKVISIKCRRVSDSEIEALIKCEGGTYVKELISGDEGRTQPSIAGISEVGAVCKELDVINIDEKPFSDDYL